MINEADTCRKYVVPKLKQAGWSDDQIVEQKYFTDGRIVTAGEKHFRKPGKKADYILRYKPDFMIAVVEAKAAYKEPGDGLQQAMNYAEILGLKFAYSTNGHGIVEHDYITGRQRFADDFPSADELWTRLKGNIGLTSEKDVQDFLFPYYRGMGAKVPRYYQEIAINRAVQAVIQGNHRILICMATGTGKTLVAFQTIWRLWKTGRIKKVLYLADMNILADQAKNQTFFPFGDALHKIQKRAAKSREIYFGLYQAIDAETEGEAIYRKYSPDFFDLIVVDECHRGSAKDDSKWRRILEYFSSAYQIGMTATPKRDDNVDTYAYFGNPVYTYSLKDGIQDGFLAPYRVIRVIPSVDATGWIPDKDQLDRFGHEVPYGLYETKDFERVVRLLSRTEAVAKHLTEYLKKTDRFAKTMIFCVDQQHAEDTRMALHNANSDLTVKYPHYVARVVSDEGKIGRGYLEKFQDPEKDDPKDSPIILTTSQMLTTGVDAQTCRNIVLFKPVNSMVQFKQIIGRGTRLFPDKDKLSFTIIDYTGATRLFADPDFDGFPELITQEEMDARGNQVKQPEVIEDNTEPPEEEPQITGEEEVEPREFYVDDVPIQIVHELVYELDPDGNRLRTWKFTDYTKEKVRELYPSANELRTRWTRTAERQQIIEALEQKGISLKFLAEVTGLADADPFDLLMYVAFNAPLRTRRERADYVRRSKKDYFELYGPGAREIILMLLDKYTEFGVTQLTDPNILKIPPISQKGSPFEIAKLFGGIEKLRKVLSDLQRFLYEPLIMPDFG